MALTSPFKAWLGVERVDLDAGEVAVVRIEVRDEMRNAQGSAHGGVISALCDVTMSAAAGRASGFSVATSDLHVSYCAPATGAEISCRARVVSARRSAVRCYGEVFADDGLVAVAVGTWARTRESRT